MLCRAHLCVAILALLSIALVVQGLPLLDLQGAMVVVDMLQDSQGGGRHAGMQACRRTAVYI